MIGARWRWLTVVAAVGLLTVVASAGYLQVSSVAETFSIHVYAWFPDGAVRRLSPAPGFFVQASVHPHGKSAVFWGGAEGRPRVWLADFGSKEARPMTSPDVGSVEPSFDWEGRRIVFASDAAAPRHLELLPTAQSWRDGTPMYDTNLNLFVIDADGRNLRQVTHGSFRDSRPAFDPEGGRVVFLSNRGGEPDGLYLAPLDGSFAPRRLLKEGGIGRPWFSPDGKWVYFFFTGVPDEHRRICRVPVDGGPWEPVTPDGFPRSHGAFAEPDGVYVWFHSTKGGGVSPYRFNLHTREVVPVMPPGFTAAAHVTRSRDGVITFDSRRFLDAPR